LLKLFSPQNTDCGDSESYQYIIDDPVSAMVCIVYLVFISFRIPLYIEFHNDVIIGRNSWLHDFQFK